MASFCTSFGIWELAALHCADPLSSLESVPVGADSGKRTHVITGMGWGGNMIAKEL